MQGSADEKSNELCTPTLLDDNNSNLYPLFQENDITILIPLKYSKTPFSLNKFITCEDFVTSQLRKLGNPLEIAKKI